MNIQQINSLDFVEILSQKMGLKPEKMNSKSIWFKSPFRPDERTASFHISQIYEYDVWFDHGNGLGGKIVDFFIHYLNTDLKGVLKYFNSTIIQAPKNYSPQKFTVKRKNSIEILKVKTLYNYKLKSYLHSRKITSKSWKYIFEIEFLINQTHKIYSIGFKNNSNSFELRNSFFKGSSGKDITTITYNSKIIKVFEGFIDFLSFIELTDDEKQYDYLIMNSTSLTNKTIEYLRANQFQDIHLYLDNDKAGNLCTEEILNHFSNALDARKKYQFYKDFNDFLIHN